MAEPTPQYPVYIEAGNKRTFAASFDWPGWARSGRDEEAALQTLLSYAARYQRVLSKAGLDFAPPVNRAALRVTEHLRGNATTDFGAPGMIPSQDYEPPTRAEITRYQAILSACWQAFHAAVAAAEGRELRKGPRGGGWTLDKIVDHVLDAETAYSRSVGAKRDRGDRSDPMEESRRRRAQVLDILSGAEDAAPSPGPRVGKRWPWRYFVRRVAWHVLDHAWEIEDRAL
jgi:hypothetical protein